MSVTAISVPVPLQKTRDCDSTADKIISVTSISGCDTCGVDVDGAGGGQRTGGAGTNTEQLFQAPAGLVRLPVTKHIVRSVWPNLAGVWPR
jgi:hypothetical protein